MRRRPAAIVIASLCVAGAMAAASRAQDGSPARPRSAPPSSKSASAATDAAPEARWQRAVDGWDAGRYPDALNELIVLMKSPARDEYLDRIALLSGELFTTIELTPDGRNPKLSPDSSYASFEVGSSASTVTRIVRVGSDVQLVAELPGSNAAFDGASRRVVYLRPSNNQQWIEAARTLDAAVSTQDRQNAQAVVNFLLGTGDLVVRDLISGAERVLTPGSLLKSAPAFSADGRVLFIGSEPSDLTRSNIYIASDATTPSRLTDEPGHKAAVLVDPTGAALVYTVTNTAPFREPGAAVAGSGRAAAREAPAGGRGETGNQGRGGGAGGAAAPNPCGAGGRNGGATPRFGVVDLRSGVTRVITGSSAAMSADGGTVAWLARTADGCALNLSPTLGDEARTLRSSSRLDAPALSPDGKLVAYQTMLPAGTDWEIFVTSQAGATRRITREIQHDVLPRFLSNDTLLGMIGEARHRRSYLYNLDNGRRTRIFANNTVRTISPEYLWLPSSDGKRLLIQAERDGDTVSPERGVYVVDLTKKVTADQVLTRLERQLVAENDLRQRMTQAFRPVRDLIQRTVAGISASRAYACEKALVDVDSKYVSQPGNAKAIEYLSQAYTSLGYTPELQWFSPQQAQGNRTANVVATLRGTESPDLIYVISSHFDSVVAGPGADDDTSGTCALLETARALAHTPLPATVVFASFTGEEAGLLGSREFVRLAAARKWDIAGALNNDMIGWAGEGARMDNTIRYSNAGIRDIQHGAAFLFTKLVTYDAKYYKSTDAQAFYDGWGDIVGGLGSYPVLGNPNYHQPSDLIQTINFEQIAETAKVTTATIAYLASSPARLSHLNVVRSSGGLKVSWQPAHEPGIRNYLVAYGPASNPLQHRLTAVGPEIALPSLPAGTMISVKATNTRGLEGWDWARTVVH